MHTLIIVFYRRCNARSAAWMAVAKLSYSRWRKRRLQSNRGERWGMVTREIEASERLVRVVGVNPLFRRGPKRIFENAHSGARSLIRSGFYGRSVIFPSSNCSRNTTVAESTETDSSSRLMEISKSKHESLFSFALVRLFTWF